MTITRGTALVLGSAVALIAGCREKGSSAETAAAAAPAPVTIPASQVVLAEETLLRSGPALAGALEAREQATLRAQVPGQVTQVFAEAGQRVAAGAPIARIDAAAVSDLFASAQATVRTAENGLELARRDLERSRRLAQAGAIAPRDLEQAELQARNADAQLAAARSQLASAGRQVGYTTVRAPFAGIIATRDVKTGDVVQPGAQIASVIDPRSLRLEANVPASVIGRLQVGTTVSFTVKGYDDPLVGRVERVAPSVDPQTGQVRLSVAVPNTRGQLIAGLFAEGRVATDSTRAVSVPAAAVDRRGLTPAVVRLKGGRVERVTVKLGLVDEAADRIGLDGIAAGDTLLVGAAQTITEGTPVRLRSPAESPAPVAASAPGR